MHPDIVRPLREDTVQLWCCSFDIHTANLKAYFEVLSADEKKRASKFKFDKDSECYIISRGILRSLIGGYLDINAKDVIFKYTSYGKPMLDFESDLKFNISHSGNMAAFAFFKNQEIGVDIEKIKDDFDVLELAQNFFSTKEIQSLEKQIPKDLPIAFFRCWTRKESFIKAEGSGLSFPLDKFAVSLENDEKAELLETQWDLKEKDEWSLFSFKPSDGYIGAVAVKHGVKNISYHNWDSN